MTYDPIDTNEADSTADGNIEAEGIDVTNNLTTTDLTISALLNGDSVVTARDGANETGDYQIQVNGSDTTGVINFKTQ